MWSSLLGLGVCVAGVLVVGGAGQLGMDSWLSCLCSYLGLSIFLSIRSIIRRIVYTLQIPS